MGLAFDPLIYINCRDRVTPLRQLVGWLEQAGHDRILLLDNDSTYEPLIEYLAESPHTVIPFATNHGARSLWTVLGPPNDWFIYTDPDIVPTADCPLDAVDRLHDILLRNPDVPKAGLGLYLDDVPVTMPSYAWETCPTIRGAAVEPGAYRSLIDTTFALYRPDAEFLYEGARTSAPYEARHVSPAWYGTALDAEDAYYLAHALAGPTGSSWKG
jgi:hypothetical protein